METGQRYAVTFTDGYADKSRICRIEIVYWFDGEGAIAGEAYFTRDDFCAKIAAGRFEHPYSGMKYTLFAPSGYTKSRDCILDVQVWQNIGRVTPTACPMNTATA